MKKQIKKKLELELTGAIQAVLAKHDAGAVGKTKKTIRQAGKSVVKKFSKTLKALTKQKEAAKAKKKNSKKASIKKGVVVRPASKYKRPRNVVAKAAPNHALTDPLISSETTGSQNP